MTPLAAPRDALPNGRVIHALVLTYTLQLKDKATVTPRLEGINRQVYDGEFEAQMYSTGHPLRPQPAQTQLCLYSALDECRLQHPHTSSPATTG